MRGGPLLWMAAIALAVAACLPPSEPTAPAPGTDEGETVTIVRTVDGDTIKTREVGTVRLIGVDTPETKKPGAPVECFGPEASDATSAAMRPGITVRLVYEQAPEGEADQRPRARRDRYGRVLAYVYTSDGRHWNQALVAQGLAKAKHYPPNDDHRVDFEQAQAKAKAGRVGGWGACGWA